MAYKLLELSAVACFSITAFSQTTPTPRPVLPGPGAILTAAFPGIPFSADKGMPFSAREVGVWTMRTQDGGTDVRKFFTMIARDSNGRIYRERRALIPGNDPRPSRLMDFVIIDPANHTRINCEPASHKCAVYAFNPVAPKQPVPGVYDHGRRTLTRDELGTQTLQDVAVTGTKETWTYQPGVIGNDKLTSTSRELWHSSDLNLDLKIVRKDPRTGEQALELTELSRSEPPASRFTIPSSYSVMDDIHPAIQGDGSADQPQF